MKRLCLSLGLLLPLLNSPIFGAEIVSPSGEALAAAKKLFETRQDIDATAAFSRLASDDPKAAAPQFYLGMLALRRSDPKSAVEFLERAVQLEPSSVTNQLRLGDAYGMQAMKAGLFSKMGLAKKCRAQYEKAVELGPENVEARWSLMEYYKQAPGFAGGSFEKAHEQADAIAKFNPGAGRFAKATIFAAEKKYDAVFAPYANALSAEPADYGLLNQLGRLAQMTGQHLEDGAAALQKCLTLTPGANEPSHTWLSLALGQIQEKRGDPVAARRAYEGALAIDANFKPAKEALARLSP